MGPLAYFSIVPGIQYTEPRENLNSQRTAYSVCRFTFKHELGNNENIVWFQLTLLKTHPG